MLYFIWFCDYVELLCTLLLQCVFFLQIFNFRNSGAPSPLRIISDPKGKRAYEFEVAWEPPETGGLEIIKYHFRLRKVNNFCHPVLLVCQRHHDIVVLLYSF